MSTRRYTKDHSYPPNEVNNSAGRFAHTNKRPKDVIPVSSCPMPCCVRSNAVTIPQELDLIDGVNYFKVRILILYDIRMLNRFFRLVR